MANVTVNRERAIDRGWSFDVHVRREDGLESDHVVDLSWADYDYWTGGRISPEHVAAAVIRFLLDRESDEDPLLTKRFDAASVRRASPDLDEHMSRLLEAST